MAFRPRGPSAVDSGGAVAHLGQSKGLLTLVSRVRTPPTIDPFHSAWTPAPAKNPRFLYPTGWSTASARQWRARRHARVVSQNTRIGKVSRFISWDADKLEETAVPSSVSSRLRHDLVTRWSLRLPGTPSGVNDVPRHHFGAPGVPEFPDDRTGRARRPLLRSSQHTRSVRPARGRPPSPPSCTRRRSPPRPLRPPSPRSCARRTARRHDPATNSSPPCTQLDSTRQNIRR